MRGWWHELEDERNTVITDQLADQLEFHWTIQLRPRLDGLTDDEYFWAPVPNCWTVHPDGGIDFDYPAPNRHRSPRSRGGWRTSSSACWPCATTRTSAARPPTIRAGRTPPTRRPRCAQLDERTKNGSAGVRGLDDDELQRPCGPAEGPYADYPHDPCPAHQPRGHPPRRRNRLHPRSLRQTPPKKEK